MKTWGPCPLGRVAVFGVVMENDGRSPQRLRESEPGLSKEVAGLRASGGV